VTTAVVVASKYGTTLEIAQRVAAGLGADTALFDLADGDPELAGFDTVVLGTAVYAGNPLPAMKAFTSANTLDGVRIGLFVGGMETDPAKREQETAAAFTPELLDRSLATAFLGGRFQFARMTRFERFIVKRVAKVTADATAIDDAAIASFVDRLRST